MPGVRFEANSAIIERLCRCRGWREILIVKCPDLRPLRRCAGIMLGLGTCALRISQNRQRTAFFNAALSGVTLPSRGNRYRPIRYRFCNRDNTPLGELLAKASTDVLACTRI